MSIESVMPPNHLILCLPLLLLPSTSPRIRVFSNESVLHIRWPKYWSFTFSISPFNEIQDWFPLGWLICTHILNLIISMNPLTWIRSGGGVISMNTLTTTHTTLFSSYLITFWFLRDVSIDYTLYFFKFNCIFNWRIITL